MRTTPDRAIACEGSSALEDRSDKLSQAEARLEETTHDPWGESLGLAPWMGLTATIDASGMSGFEAFSQGIVTTTSALITR